jgi:hypothetical protein
MLRGHRPSRSVAECSKKHHDGQNDVLTPAAHNGEAALIARARQELSIMG